MQWNIQLIWIELRHKVIRIAIATLERLNLPEMTEANQSYVQAPRDNFIILIGQQQNLLACRGCATSRLKNKYYKGTSPINNCRTQSRCDETTNIK